ncbi:MAG: putative porin [Gilvibacter sp.]
MSLLQRIVFVLVFLLAAPMGWAQDDNPFSKGKQQTDNVDRGRNKTGKNITNPEEKPPIELYKIISSVRDTTYLDTTLSMAKDYKFNYLRKDDFELLPFSNVGQTYNSLGYDFEKLMLKPSFGARARHFNYYEIEDTYYYQVPTPLTELYFKTAFEQGQQLDAFFTINTNKRLNFSIAYKGLRSLGQYQHIRTSTGNFRFTTNYTTRNQRYFVRAHMVTQDLLNQENGGIRDAFIPLFISNDSEFTDRGRIEVNFENAENILVGKRFHLDHQYVLIKPDSTHSNEVRIGNILSFEDKYFEYRQDSPYLGFGDSYQTEGLRDRTTLEDFYAEANVTYKNNTLGSIGFFAGYSDLNYGYNTVLQLDEGTITNRIKGNFIRVGGSFAKQYKGFSLNAAAGYNVSGDFEGNYVKGQIGFVFNERNAVKAGISINSKAPNFNFLLNQSDYIAYNWQNDFKNVQQQRLSLQFDSDQFFDAEVSYTGIDNFTYFLGSNLTTEDGTVVTTPKPFQFDGRVDYFKATVSKEIRYKKFGLTNTVMYQKAFDGQSVFKVPEVVTRNSLFYADEWFDKALKVQTGVTFKYFTEYQMNRYDPVLAEFYVQRDQNFGGFPLVDVFFNAKVRQTRIFFKFEHINSLFSSNNQYFADPQNPYRDAVVRFGLVWNFFL